MKLSVTVKTNARKNEVAKADDGTYRVAVTASPIEGKANKAVIKLLAEYFDVPKSHIEIIAGHSSKQKMFEVYDILTAKQ